MGQPLQCHIQEMSAASLLPQKLRSFNIDSTSLSMFYKSHIQCFDFFICWFGNISQKNKNKLQHIVNISSKITSFNPLSLLCMKSRYCVKPIQLLMTIHISYITSTSFCPRPESSELSYPKQILSMVHSLQCLYDFSTISTSDVMCACCILFLLFVKEQPQF